MAIKMRFILTTVLSFFVLTVLSTQKQDSGYMSCTVTITFFDRAKQAKPQLLEKRYFDKLGRITKEVNYRRDGGFKERHFYYADTLLYRQYTFTDKNDVLFTEYLYENGFLKEEIQAIDADLIERMTYWYDSKNNVIKKEKKMYAKGQLMGRPSIEYLSYDEGNRLSQSILINGKDTTLISVYNYGGSDKLNSVVFWEKATNEKTEEKYGYDQNGNLIAKVSLINNQPSFTYNYFYNAASLLVKYETKSRDGSILASEINTYTSEGNLLKKIKKDFKFNKTAIQIYENDQLIVEEFLENDQLKKRLTYAYRKM